MPTCSAFGLDAAQDPARASGGERKRAALALAFALDADAIRADTARSAELESLLMEKLERWDALESRARDGA